MYCATYVALLRHVSGTKSQIVMIRDLWMMMNEEGLCQVHLGLPNLHVLSQGYVI